MSQRDKVLSCFETIIEKVLEFKASGDFEGAVVFLFQEEKAILVPPSYLPSDKAELVGFVRGLSDYTEARYVVFACEAWVSQTPGAPPSEQEDRTEALIITVDGPDLNRMVTVPLLPDGGFGERFQTNDYGGLFSNLSGNAGIN